MLIRLIYPVYTVCCAVRELSTDEKQTIMLSADFQKFMSRAGRVIERALAESVDICTDYTGGGDAQDAQSVQHTFLFTSS